MFYILYVSHFACQLCKFIRFTFYMSVASTYIAYICMPSQWFTFYMFYVLHPYSHVNSINQRITYVCPYKVNVLHFMFYMSVASTYVSYTCLPSQFLHFICFTLYIPLHMLILSINVSLIYVCKFNVLHFTCYFFNLYITMS